MLVLQSIFKNRTKYYRIDIEKHWSDGSLVWSAHNIGTHISQYNIIMAEKVKCWTRAEQRSFPKTVARYAQDLVQICNDKAAA